MKFTDGYWRKRDGFAVLHPAQLHDTESDGTSLTAYAVAKPVQTRSDTLDAPIITIRCEAPMPDVIRVTVGHFLGGVAQGPNFAHRRRAPADVSIGEAEITSGALTARFRPGEQWGLDFLADGRRLTGSGWKGMGIVDTARR